MFFGPSLHLQQYHRVGFVTTLPYWEIAGGLDVRLIHPTLTPRCLPTLPPTSANVSDIRPGEIDHAVSSIGTYSLDGDIVVNEYGLMELILVDIVACVRYLIPVIGSITLLYWIWCFDNDWGDRLGGI